jgi:hypothetical protein
MTPGKIHNIHQALYTNIYQPFQGKSCMFLPLFFKNMAFPVQLPASQKARILQLTERLVEAIFTKENDQLKLT